MGHSDALTTQEVAERLRLSPRTLELWRQRGDGPPYVRVGPRRVLYRRADVETWLASRLVEVGR